MAQATALVALLTAMVQAEPRARAKVLKDMAQQAFALAHRLATFLEIQVFFVL
ncbi:MAG: hypothetical protein ACLP9S_04640 [Syntrophales bacterium]